jgi:hypothetical protein
MITINTNKLTLLAGTILLAAAAFFIPTDAFANTAKDLQETTTQLGTQIGTIPRLIALAAYVIGAFFAVRALFALKGFIEAPDDNPVTKVLGFGAVAALLILLPYIINVMTKSIGASETGVSSSHAKFDKVTTLD